MAESVTRQALRETAAALRLNKPVLAALLTAIAFCGGWWWTGQPALGGVWALAAALIAFVPLFVWNWVSIVGKRLMALEDRGTNENAAQAAQEVRQRRRKIIDDARKMVASYELQTRWDWRQTMRYSQAFTAVRPHLSNEYMQAVANDQRLVIAGEIHEFLVAFFLKELDRLERDWGLS